jgi:hypothetical protein
MEMKECEIVSCGSKHPICYGCEMKWRRRMPLTDGVRIMTCPTCRRPEQYRTIASLQRKARNTSLASLVQKAEHLVVCASSFVRTSETIFIERAAALLSAVAAQEVLTEVPGPAS